MPPPVKLNDIIGGLEFQSDEGSSYLNMTTGEVVYVTEEELQAAEEDGPLEAFPECQRNAIRGRGAFRYFKDRIHAYGIADD